MVVDHSSPSGLGFGNHLIQLLNKIKVFRRLTSSTTYTHCCCKCYTKFHFALNYDSAVELLKGRFGPSKLYLLTWIANY